MAGVYLHVPFCRQACHYCDFHFSTNTQTVDAMVRSIASEARLRAPHFLASLSGPVTTLYLGGGTPSLLTPDAMKRLVREVSDALHLDVSTLAEVTLEANPEDLEDERLDAWLEAGFNRLSVGIQSFDDETLIWMNRAHTGREAEQGILRAHAAGFETMTVDLIYGVPTGRQWQDDVERALTLPVRHLSAYALTVEPQTVLGTRVERGEETPPPDERTVQEYNHLCSVMADRGWSHYETSNWAAPCDDKGHWKAIHNSAYWSGKPYLGLGPGAHGFLAPERYANVSNNPTYIRALEQGALSESRESLSRADRYNEAVMTGLRTAQGIHPEDLHETHGLRPDVVDPKAWSHALNCGDLVAIEGGRFRVPETQWITGDRVAASLFHVA